MVPLGTYEGMVMLNVTGVIERKECRIHGSLSSQGMPFFVNAPDLFIHSRTVGWLLQGP